MESKGCNTHRFQLLSLFWDNDTEVKGRFLMGQETIYKRIKSASFIKVKL